MILSLSGELFAAEGMADGDQLRQLQNQNKILQEQLKQQRALIDSLTLKVNQIQQSEDMRKGEPAYSKNP